MTDNFSNEEQKEVVNSGGNIASNNDVAESPKKVSVILILGILVLVSVVVIIATFLFNRFANTEPTGLVDVSDVQDVPELEAEQNRVTENKNDYDYDVLMLFNDDSIGYYFGRTGDGLTLYVKREEDCVNTCSQDMEPYTTDVPYEPVAEQQLGTVELESDTHQYVWKGKELFIYNKDLMTGDVLGDGLDDSWTIARP